MENSTDPVEEVGSKPEWEAPELTVDSVAAITQNGPTFEFTDGDSGS